MDESQSQHQESVTPSYSGGMRHGVWQFLPAVVLASSMLWFIPPSSAQQSAEKYTGYSPRAKAESVADRPGARSKAARDAKAIAKAKSKATGKGKGKGKGQATAKAQSKAKAKVQGKAKPQINARIKAPAKIKADAQVRSAKASKKNGSTRATTASRRDGAATAPVGLAKNRSATAKKRGSALKKAAAATPQRTATARKSVRAPAANQAKNAGPPRSAMAKSGSAPKARGVRSPAKASAADLTPRRPAIRDIAPDKTASKAVASSTGSAGVKGALAAAPLTTPAPTPAGKIGALPDKVAPAAPAGARASAARTNETNPSGSLWPATPAVWTGMALLAGAVGALLYRRRRAPVEAPPLPHIDPTMAVPAVEVALASNVVKADLMQRAEPFFVDLRTASVRKDHEFILQHCTEDMATSLILDSEIANVPSEPHVEGLKAELVDLFEEVNRYVASVQYTADEQLGNHRPRKVREVWHFVREPDASDWRLAAVETT